MENINNNTEGHSEFQARGLDVRPSSLKAIEVEAGNYLEAV